MEGVRKDIIINNAPVADLVVKDDRTNNSMNENDTSKDLPIGHDRATYDTSGDNLANKEKPIADYKISSNR